MGQVTQPRCPARWRIGLCAAVLVCSAIPSQGAESEPSLEYRVKAAFLLNFAKFVEWPAGETPASESPIAICVIGEDPFDGPTAADAGHVQQVVREQHALLGGQLAEGEADDALGGGA